MPSGQGRALSWCTLQEFLSRTQGRTQAALPPQSGDSNFNLGIFPLLWNHPFPAEEIPGVWCLISFLILSCLPVFYTMRLNMLAYFFYPQLLMNKQIGLKRYEVDGRKVLFYFDEVMTIFLIIMLDFNERQMARGWGTGRVLGVPQEGEDHSAAVTGQCLSLFCCRWCCGFGWKPKSNRGRWFTSAHGVVLGRYHSVLLPQNNVTCRYN